MNKVKALSILSIALVAVNVGLIWFLVSHRPPFGKHEGPKNVIIKKLNLDEGQVKEYQKLIDWHRQNIGTAEQKMFDLKHALYATLAQDENTAVSDSLKQEIGKVQVEIENINFKHFQDIKKLCKAEQVKLFEELSEDIAQLFNAKRMTPDARR